MLRKSMWLSLLGFAVVSACSVSAEEELSIEGARELPALTADGHVAWLRIEYSFLYRVEGPAPKTEIERDIVDLMRINAEGIINSRIATSVVPAVSELSLDEIKAMENGDPSANALLLHVRRTLEEALAEGVLQDISMKLIDPW
jgi:hypothetical protein